MIIKNVKIVNYNKTIKNANVEIKNGKIFKISPQKGESKKILIPGFIDQHIHGFGGKDAMDGSAAVEFMSKELAKIGTTSFLPTLMTSENLVEKIADSTKAKTINSKILGYHLEGPFISFEKKGAHDEKYILKATKRDILKFISASENKIRKMTIAPENFSKKYLKILIENNIIPSVGHSNASAKTTAEYFRDGASGVTHLWNAMSPVANRNPGIAEEALLNDSVMAEMILDFVHVDKSTAKLSIEAKGIETITLVTDAIRPAGTKDGDSTSGGLEVTKKGNLITLKGTNTIAGSGATMHDNFKNVIELGYDLETAVALTSYNASIYLGENKLGEIKRGYIADLVLMDEKFKILNVYVDGEKI